MVNEFIMSNIQPHVMSLNAFITIASHHL